MNVENDGERMDIDFYNMIYDNFDAYQKSHYMRYKFAQTLLSETDVCGDMACGSGYGSLMLSTMCNKVVGYDIDGTTIQEIQGRYQSENKVDFIQKNLLDIEDYSKFDFIFSFETIEHFKPSDIGTLIEIFKRALKPGGVLVFSTPYDQQDNYLSRKHHKCFNITESFIHSVMYPQFTILYMLYQNYDTHEIHKDLQSKDFIICVAASNK